MRWFHTIVRVQLIIIPVVVFALSTTTASSVLAEQFTIDLPQLEQGYSNEYTYTESSAEVPINLGTSLAALSSVQLELSLGGLVGTQQSIPPGTFQSAPPTLEAFMNVGAPPALQWEQTFTANSNGMFSPTMTFYGGGNTPNWSFLQGGVTDIQFDFSTYPLNYGFYWQGYPWINVYTATLVIDATPTPEPSLIGLLAMGTVSAIGYRSWLRRRA